MTDEQFRHDDDRHQRRQQDVRVIVEVYRKLSQDLDKHFARLANQLHHVSGNLHHKLENVMSNQEHLDASVAQLGTQFQQVADEVAALKQQIEDGTQAEALDFSGLDAAVQTVTDAVPDAEPAPDPEPEPDPVPVPAGE